MGSVNLSNSKSNAATQPSTTNPKLQKTKKLETQPPTTTTPTSQSQSQPKPQSPANPPTQIRGDAYRDSYRDAYRDPYTRPASRLSKRLSSFEPPTANRRPTIITKSVAKAHHQHTAATAAPTATRTTTPTTPSFARSARRQTGSSIATESSSSSAKPPPTPKLRDHNASSGPSTLLKPSGTAAATTITTTTPGDKNMSYETNSNRPQMPSLSAAAARTMNRVPLTPKIASRGPQSPGLTTTTPMNRRPQRPATANSNRDSYHDEPSPALAPHLSHNITPRSGSRQTRVDSGNTTPNGTPNPDRYSEGWDPKSSFRLSSPPFEGDAARRPVVTFSLVNHDKNGQGLQDAQDTPESKFFHANDAKTARPASTRPVSASKPPQQPKGPTFFYANGNTVENKPASPVTPAAPAAPAPSHAQENPAGSKFMYANGAPESQPRPSPLASRRSGSTSSTTSKAHTSRPSISHTSSGHSSVQRPSSPPNAPSQPHAPPKNVTIPQGAIGRPHVTSPQLAPSPPGLRRTSLGASRPTGHSRSGSLVKGDSGLGITRPPLASPKSEAFPLTPGVSRPAPLTLASIIQAAEEFTEKEEDIASPSPDEVNSGLQSPKSPQSAEPVNELVANARRERKVQDLQITNASLEAINRTLERQLRKQTAELRRYKRLSRSGRLSAAPTPVPIPESSDSQTEHHAVGLKLLDVSEGEEDGDKEPGEEEEEESLSDSASSSLSPSDIAEHDAKHRPRDEQRLQLDLTKHQEFLVDSQKINQSIKRCLNWTEELIKDGKKALEYRVKPSDVVLGGRVLDPLDDDEDERAYSVDDSLDGTLDDTLDDTPDDSPDDTITFDTKSIEDGEPLPNWGVGPQDRDSGIELRVDGG